MIQKAKGNNETSQDVMGLQASAKRPDHGYGVHGPYITIQVSIGNIDKENSFTRRRTAVECSGDLGWYGRLFPKHLHRRHDRGQGSGSQ